MAVKTTYFFGSYSSKKNLLDKFTNATVGYSLRKLRAGYTGYAIRVIRDSDNAYLDIGFVNDELDVSSLMSFIGGDTAFVHTWYFQGLVGEGIDAVQAVKANMPRIVHNGVIETLNGKPALNFMANQYFDLGGDIRYNTYSTPGTYGYVVASFAVLPKVHGLFGKSSTTGTSRVSLHNSVTTGVSSIRSSNTVSLPSPPINTQSIMYQLIIGSNNTVGLNATTNTNSGTSNSNNTRHYFIGAYGDSTGTTPGAGYYLDGKMQELVQFYNDKSAVQLDIRDDINDYYGTY